MTSPPLLTPTYLSCVCLLPPFAHRRFPWEYRRSLPKSLPDQHVRPHNIPDPPLPVPLRRTYPPAPSTTQTHPKIKSNLPPNGHFLLSSHCRSTLTPTSSTTTTPTGDASPVIGSASLSGSPEPPPLTTLSASSSSVSLSVSSSHSSSSSDPIIKATPPIVPSPRYPHPLSRLRRWRAETHQTLQDSSTTRFTV